MRLPIRIKILIFTIVIIVVLLAVLHVTMSTLVAQNLEEQLRKRAELALENVSIWFVEQKNSLFQQASIMAASDMLQMALNDPNVLYMHQFEQEGLSNQVEIFLVENTQYGWVYEICKNPADRGSRIKSRSEVFGDSVWRSQGMPGYVPVRDGLILAVTIPVGNERNRLALLTVGELFDNSDKEDLVIISGAEFVHIFDGKTFYSSTFNQNEKKEFVSNFPEDFAEDTPYYVEIGDRRFMTMARALYSPDNQEVVSYLIVQFGEEENKRFLQNVSTTMVGLGLLFFLIFAGVSIVFSGRITTNLKDLVTSITAMGEGDYKTKVAIHSSDEIGLLGDSFDQLRVKLRQRTEELLQANRDLDKRVHEMESLNTVLVAIASKRVLDEVFIIIAKEAAKQFTIDFAFLALRSDVNRPVINVVAYHDFRGERIIPPQRSLEQGMISYLDGHNEPLQLEVSSDSSYLEEAWLADSGFKSVWLLPIGDEEERFGFLCLASKELQELSDPQRDYISRLCTEITVALQRFRINEELQLIEGRLQRLFDSMRDGIIQTDSIGIITVYNKAAASMFGIEQSEAGLRLQDLFVDQNQFADLLAQMEENGYVSGLAAVLRHANGGAFDAELNLTYTDGNSGERGLEGTIRDVTTRKRLEEQLVRSERLASMGQIAASVAHEINNPLGIILGFTQDLISEKDQQDSDLEALNTIEEETKRCARIVKDLLDLARADRTVREKIDLKKLIERSMPLFKLHFRGDALQSVLNLEEVEPILGDEKQIQQILINVILNAVHACSESGGTISISLSQEEVVENGRKWAVITVNDTGHGIEEQNLDRVFDPFFTTKRAGGSGLGLFIVHRLVEAHGGTISIQSESGSGTEIKIKFPFLE
jgi:two-component system NtrC family sensor kinase